MLSESMCRSPSAIKPSHVVNAWAELDIPLELRSVTPISKQALYLAHDREFVDRVLNGLAPNGFKNYSDDIAISVRYTNGSMLDAAVQAIENGQVAISPSSGFHHAHFDEARGFCTFNGLMVTACVLKKRGLVSKVGILDADMHFGNGTEDIIETLNADSWINHYSVGRYYVSPAQTADFFDVLPEILDSMSDCDVMLYQAGADPHIKDPLGGWLTTEEISQRDKVVFQWCKENSMPVAWNLAGGYQVLPCGETDWDALTEIHSNTLKSCWNIYGQK